MGANPGRTHLNASVGGDFQAFAKFLTWLERSSPAEALSLKELLEPAQTAFRFGLTGPPGAGKSTLVGLLIEALSARGLKIGVMAVDPSSPFSKGAILGDRIRYSEHFLKSNVFIRSLGTRGSVGGLSSSAFLMARAFDACGFDVLLIETVGVGQTELDVLHVADQVGVVLVPESGDSIQAMKAGLMEIADVFVVNKCDRPGADGLAREIEAAGALGEVASSIPIFKTAALNGEGLDPLTEWIVANSQIRRRTEPARLREEGKALLRSTWEREINQRLSSVQTPNDLLKAVSPGDDSA